MTILTHTGGPASSALWCFCLTVASAIFPWVNAEIIVLALRAGSPSKYAIFLLVIAATAGQMTGKSMLYFAGRKGEQALPSKVARLMQKWRRWLEAHPSGAHGLVLISAITGLPPFYAMTLVAGAVKMKFAHYLLVGTTGRLIHFAAVAYLPGLALSVLRKSV